MTYKYLIVNNLDQKLLFEDLAEVGQFLNADLKYINIDEYQDDSVSPRLAALRFFNDILISPFDVSQIDNEEEEEQYLYPLILDHLSKYYKTINFEFIADYMESGCEYITNSDCNNLDVYMLGDKLIISEQGSQSGYHVSEAFLELKNSIKQDYDFDLFELV